MSSASFSITGDRKELDDIDCVSLSLFSANKRGRFHTPNFCLLLPFDGGGFVFELFRVGLVLERFDLRVILTTI